LAVSAHWIREPPPPIEEPPLSHHFPIRFRSQNQDVSESVPRFISKSTGSYKWVVPSGTLNWGKPKMTHAATFDVQSRIGLFVCSGNTFASTTGVFDKVNVSQ